MSARRQIVCINSCGEALLVQIIHSLARFSSLHFASSLVPLQFVAMAQKHICIVSLNVWKWRRGCSLVICQVMWWIWRKMTFHLGVWSGVMVCPSVHNPLMWLVRWLKTCCRRRGILVWCSNSHSIGLGIIRVQQLDHLRQNSTL